MQENMRTIFQDVETLKWKVDRIEKMFEELIEIYTDVLYEIRNEYLEKLEKIRKEGEFEKFSDIDDLKRLIEEE